MKYLITIAFWLASCLLAGNMLITKVVAVSTGMC